MNSATTTSVETSTNGAAVSRRPDSYDPSIPEAEASKPTTTSGERLRKSTVKKYRHVVAVHSKTRPSTLSRDSDTSPSFLGFRNLMVIVLGESSLAGVSWRYHELMMSTQWLEICA